MTEQERQLGVAVLLIAFASIRLIDIHYTEKLKARRELEKDGPKVIARGKVSVPMLVGCAVLAILSIPLFLAAYEWFLETLVLISHNADCGNLDAAPVDGLALIVVDFLCGYLPYAAWFLALITSAQVFISLYALAERFSAPADGEFQA